MEDITTLLKAMFPSDDDYNKIWSLAEDIEQKSGLIGTAPHMVGICALLIVAANSASRHEKIHNDDDLVELSTHLERDIFRNAMWTFYHHPTGTYTRN